MRYLSGCISPHLPDGVGYMVTPMMGNRIPDARPWAADTGCFAAPDRHDDVQYLHWLLTRWNRAHCLFATAPDVVGDGAATLRRSRKMLPLIRAVGYRAALVAQDGMERLELPWAEFDALFVGGTTEWKLSAASEELMREARRQGKYVHIGRVNSLRRLRWAQAFADSVDGTYVAFGPKVNGQRLAQWLKELDRQPQLPLNAIGDGDGEGMGDE